MSQQDSPAQKNSNATSFSYYEHTGALDLSAMKIKSLQASPSKDITTTPNSPKIEPILDPSHKLYKNMTIDDPNDDTNSKIGSKKVNFEALNIINSPTGTGSSTRNNKVNMVSSNTLSNEPEADNAERDNPMHLSAENELSSLRPKATPKEKK